MVAALLSRIATTNICTGPPFNLILLLEEIATKFKYIYFETQSSMNVIIVADVENVSKKKV